MKLPLAFLHILHKKVLNHNWQRHQKARLFLLHLEMQIVLVEHQVAAMKEIHDNIYGVGKDYFERLQALRQGL